MINYRESCSPTVVLSVAKKCSLQKLPVLYNIFLHDWERDIDDLYWSSILFLQFQWI
jgi:hypothetical protein